MYQYRTYMHYTCAHSILFLPATATQWGRMVTVARLNPSAMLSQAQSFVSGSAQLILLTQSPTTASCLISTRLPLPASKVCRVFANSALIES